MTPETRYTVTSNILQIEESFRDAVVRAQEERYRKLREVVAALLTTEVVIAPGALEDKL